MIQKRASYWVLGAMFKARGLLMIPPLMYTFLHYDPRFEESGQSWAIGLLLFCGGLYLRVAAQRHLRYRLNSRKRLATTGPYRVIRNPVYCANISMFAGLACMAELPWMVPVVVLWAFTIYVFTIRFEEVRLNQRFGSEYAAYAATTPRWIPRFSEKSAARESHGSRWWNALAVEAHCLLLVLLPITKEILEWKFGGWQF